ncbi:MAG: hypothetical protein JSS32_01725 [Verrucomicrobia bacterium]|nr:hypothetical protein [Verrucomicrobiota bacterium]
MKYILPLFFAASLFADDNLPAIAASGTKSLVVIEAKSRASDLAQAFDLLKRDKSTLKINMRTTSGANIPNVVELTPSTNGTLLFLKILSSQGLRYQVVFTDEVAEINYSQ